MTLPTSPRDSQPATAKETERVVIAADTWKRKLLDLTKRNRSLNFKPTRVSTLTVIDEQPSEVFRLLYLREKSMRFKAAVVAVATARSTETSDAISQYDAEEVDDLVGTHFVPYDPAALDARHTDDWLQTSVSPESLDKSLRRIDEQARLSLDEQGVNTLFLGLGMLQYAESKDSSIYMKAPLVLLPVEVARSSARLGYTLRASDDEPIVNPALAEYLRRDYGLALPTLPDADSMPDDYDLQSFFAATRNEIGGRQGWVVTTDIVLSLFDFQKFVMYKDLEANADALVSHRLVRQLITRRSTHDGAVVGLPTDIRDIVLDVAYAPESTAQVVDADSSQLRAIASVSRGHDMVIEGPPGTGKSQTITNLIAQALSDGKSVLFVAEKGAALSVVHERLKAAGLGEFCLDLHSRAANKRAVMKELGSAIDLSLHSTAVASSATQRLPHVRTHLTDYVKAVHEPFGGLSVSPYHAFGAFDRVATTPRVTYSGAAEHGVTPVQLADTLRGLAELSQAGERVGLPAAHPWRDTARTFYTADVLDDVCRLAAALSTSIAELTSRADRLRVAFALPQVRTLADADTAVGVAEVMQRSPGAPLSVLASDAWNAPPADATRLIADGRAVTALSERLSRRLNADALLRRHADDIGYVTQKTSGLFGFLAVLDGRFREIRNRWTSYRQSGYTPSLVEQASEMALLDRLLVDRDKLTSAAERGQALFGKLWQGESSAWDVLDNYVRWVVEFRHVCVQHGLSERALETVTQATPDLSEIRMVQERASLVAVQLEEIRTLVEWPLGYFDASSLDEITARLQALIDARLEAPRWSAFEVCRRAIMQGAAAEFMPAIMSGSLAHGDLVSAFERAFWQKWLMTVAKARPHLEAFQTLTHEQRVAEFRDLDSRVLLENRGRLIAALRGRLQVALRTEAAAAGMPVLRKEMARQRGLAPLRKTMKAAEHAIRAIKPCFMMSPLTVAQYLSGSAPTFDLVIFDEASQLPAEDAVGAIIRGKQLVVVGDPKQLPPTNFFSAQNAAVPSTLGDDGQPVFEDSESILEEYMGAGVPMSRLKWHYRSAHESLINFSNVQFYDSDLYTFPSPETSTEQIGLQFEYVNGVYAGKGYNAIEAVRVADEVVRFAVEQIGRNARGERSQSLGVGTFNMRQQLGILDELEVRRREHPEIEPFFSRGVSEPFFVKNLENIQGDERDVIFLSVTYGRSQDGVLRNRFGPLNGENGWRRLNVLTTRARQRMRVFSSMRGDEINIATSNSRGAVLLREFLLYAERGVLESVTATIAASTESPFELAVLTALRDRGVNVVPQVGVAGYRIDLGVLDDAVEGRFLCGIECDGVAYHSSETARDRDRLRQQVLELRGWRIYRIWSTDWFKDRAGQIERIMALIEKARLEVAADAAARELRAQESALLDQSASVGTSLSGVPVQPVISEPPYVRPVATTYTVASAAGKYVGTDLLETPISSIARVVAHVITVESPVHVTDVVSRVAGVWESRAGSRISARIMEALRSTCMAGLASRRGDYCWSTSEDAVPRARAAVKIPGERIAPEEYDATIQLVLGYGHGFARSQLITEVRAVLGFGRTGPALEEAIGAAIERLLSKGTLGESSTGLRLRKPEQS